MNAYERHLDMLKRSLSKLEKRSRVAFASACAERLLAGMRRGRRWRTFRTSLDRLWSELPFRAPRAAWVIATQKQCLQNIPDVEHPAWDSRTEDGGTATTHALRCSLARGKADVEEAELAANCVLESIECELSRRGALDEDADDDAWMMHPRVVAEVERQRRDLDELARRTVSIAQLRARAAEEGKRLLPPTRKRR